MNSSIQSNQPGRSEPARDAESEDAWPELREHLELCREILSALEQGDAGPSSPTGSDRRDDFTNVQTLRDWAGRLGESTVRLKARRARWPTGTALPATTARLVRQSQDLMMKILVLDREHERARLRDGSASLAQLACRRQPAHFVADLYRRNRLL